jgi:lysophospholipid acyltransferase (LPLAT)-like uncharacterized protein
MTLQLIGKTSRLRSVYHPEAEALRKKKKPFIYTFWHRFQLLMVYEHRHQGVPVLVSRSRDGELIAQVLHRFGFRTVRGSSSRGGARALSELFQWAEAGSCLAFTPDGPRGPYRSVQPGVVSVAQKKGLPIVPLAWAGTRVKELSTWDRFLVPLPFGRYTVFFDKPLWLSPEDSSPEEKVRQALDHAAEEAEKLLRRG